MPSTAVTSSSDLYEQIEAVVAGMHQPGAPDGVAQFAVTGAKGAARSFHLCVSAGSVSITAGRHKSPDMVLSWKLADLKACLAGDLPVEVGYMSGRVKLQGDQVLLFDGWRALIAQFRHPANT